MPFQSNVIDYSDSPMWLNVHESLEFKTEPSLVQPPHNGNHYLLLYYLVRNAHQLSRT